MRGATLADETRHDRCRHSEGIVADELTDYIHATGLADAGEDELANALAVVAAVVEDTGQIQASLIRLVQVLCLEPADPAATKSALVTNLVNRLRTNRGTAARGDTAGRWARAVAFGALDALQAKYIEADAPLWALAPAICGAAAGERELPMTTLAARASEEMERHGGRTPDDTDFVQDELAPRVNLLWWAESAWSGALRIEYSGIPLAHRGVWMVEDFAALAPPGAAAEAFLARVLRREGVELELMATGAEHALRARAAWAWGRSRRPVAVPPVPAALDALLREESIGFPASAAALDLPPPRAEASCSSIAWLLGLYRERVFARIAWPAA